MKFLITLLVAFFMFGNVNAAKVDIYKTAFQNKTLTLKYQIHTFKSRSISKISKINVMRGSIYDLENLGESSADTGGIIVLDKENSYIENYHDVYQDTYYADGNSFLGTFNAGGRFLLKKESEYGLSYSFEIKNGKKNYAVTNISQRDIDELHPYWLMFYEYNCGNPKLYQALAAVLPPERIIARPDTPTFNFVGAGNLTNGFSYEDFYAEKNNNYFAIRYYFKGDNPEGIAMLKYTKNGNDITYLKKSFVVFEEFSLTPDKNYLQIPADLKDGAK